MLIKHGNIINANWSRVINPKESVSNSHDIGKLHRGDT